LEKIAPLLAGGDVLFKAPATLAEAQKINCGLYYGYTQIGKLITIYPRSPEESVRLARQLHALIGHSPAPIIPFDLRFQPDSCVYYRYGAFKRYEIESPNGARTPAIRDPEGNLIPDRRSLAKPDWVVSPFLEQAPNMGPAAGASPLETTYKAFRALTQRGKGGVYEAVDLSSATPRLSILKEGRCEGETEWDGRDGFWRVKNEEHVLKSLRAAGVDAPRVYSSFTVEGNYYLATEFIQGQTVHAYLLKRRRRLSMTHALRLGAKLAALLARVHDAGWAWRDFKPSNVILTKKGELRPLDFEGACPAGRPDPAPWGTQGFTPSEWRPDAKSRIYEDLYSLGAILYLLLTGELPKPLSPIPVENLRRNTPSEARRLIAELLSADPRLQPAARQVAQRLVASSPMRKAWA
jgi:serine/threonine protein kinase